MKNVYVIINSTESNSTDTGFSVISEVHGSLKGVKTFIRMYAGNYFERDGIEEAIKRLKTNDFIYGEYNFGGSFIVRKEEVR